MEKLKVIYIGSMVEAAEYIFFNECMELEGIICEEEKVSDKLFTYSCARGIKLYGTNSLNPIEGLINNLDNSFLYIMCSYGKRIPAEKINNPKIFNIHYALLPGYKGRHPTYWATVSGEKYVGITLHEVNKDFDSGNIICQERVPYYFWENETMLFQKLTGLIPELLKKFVNYFAGDSKDTRNCPGSYFPPVKEEDILIDIGKDDLPMIYNKVRSQTRAGGAKIMSGDKIFKLFDVSFRRYRLQSDYETQGQQLMIRYSQEICIISNCYQEEGI